MTYWRRQTLVFVWLACGCALSAPRLLRADSPAAQATATSEHDYPAEMLPNSNGGNLSLADAKGRAGTVLVCMSVDCPISNEYIPTLNRLAEEYRARDVRFIGINPDASQTLQQMADHKRDFKLAFPFVKDTGGKITRRLKMKVTPEVCLFDSQGRRVYSGRIDDRYRARGGAAGTAIDADLRRALDELLSDKPVSVPRTKAVGCPIQLPSAD